MRYGRIEFEAPLWQLLGGVEGFKPRVYVGLTELMYGREYRASLRGSRSEPPKVRERGSLVAVYALLYKTQEGGKATLKFGSTSVFSGSAGMLWAQAPLYARVVGIFRLNRDLGLEDLENRCIKLARSLGCYRKVFDFIGRAPSVRRIVNMWSRMEDLGGDVENLISYVDEISHICFDHLAGSTDVDPVYGSDMWFQQPMEGIRMEFPPADSPTLSLRRLRRAGMRGLFRVMPIGLCMFVELNNGRRRVYIDTCRNFAYSTEILIEG